MIEPEPFGELLRAVEGATKALSRLALYSRWLCMLGFGLVNFVERNGLTSI